MNYTTSLPQTFLFQNLNINESIYYSLFYRFYQSTTHDQDTPDHQALDATVQTLHNHLSRVTLTTILRTLKSKHYIHPTELTPLINPNNLPSPPITNKVITTKIGRPT